jgi:GNAT superfamily N-acetyltransferase
LQERGSKRQRHILDHPRTLNSGRIGVSLILAERVNDLFARAWPEHSPRSYAPVLARSLGVAAAYVGGRLIGFVCLATDGGEHAFLLDPTVAIDYRRRGIGLQLVQRAAALAQTRGCTWLHVDYEPTLAPFYKAAGFRESLAGVMRL